MKMAQGRGIVATIMGLVLISYAVSSLTSSKAARTVQKETARKTIEKVDFREEKGARLDVLSKYNAYLLDGVRGIGIEGEQLDVALPLEKVADFDTLTHSCVRSLKSIAASIGGLRESSPRMSMDEFYRQTDSLSSAEAVVFLNLQKARSILGTAKAN